MSRARLRLLALGSLGVSVTAGMVVTIVGCASSGLTAQEEGQQAWDAQRAALKYELASAELKQGHVDKALNLAREAVGLSPEQPGHALLLARVYMAGGDFRAARNVLRGVQASHPDFGPASYLLGAICERERRWGQAVEAYSQAVDACPDDLDYRIALAQAVAQGGDDSAAISVLLDGEERFAAEPKYHLARAELYEQAGRLSEACAAYRQVLMLGIDDPAVQTSLGLCLYWAGDVQEACEVLEPLVRRDKEVDSAVMCACAGCLLANGRPQRAADWLLRFTAQRPDVVQLWLLLARAQSSLGDMQAAVQAARRAAQLSPRSPEVLTVVAAAYLAGGDASAAEEAARRALAIDPDNVEALLVYGRTCEHRGDGRAAAQAYRAALELEPSDLAAELLAALDERETDFHRP